MKALLMINFQNDFLSFGSQAVKDSERILENCLALMRGYDCLIALRSWHTADNLAFAANHPWRRPGQEMEIGGIQQRLWTIFCVQNTYGAHWMPGIEADSFDLILDLGTQSEALYYSGFKQENGGKALMAFLNKREIQEIDLCGYLSEFHILETAVDALAMGYKVGVIEKGCGSLEETDTALLFESYPAINIK